MKRSRRHRWIAILSTISIAGGVAISASVALQMQSSRAELHKIYRPIASQNRNDSKTAMVERVKPRPGSYIGTLNIPTLKQSINIFEGTDAKSLSKGVGHYLRSVMPGVQDNSVLAGHRDTVFSNLGKVKLGEFILVTTQDGTFIYQVSRIRIVEKNDRTVIVPTTAATLTLSTCYPFRFVGNAPRRYIVQAKLIPYENEGT